jgi:sugar phosphate isomerase/epimerase
MRYGCRAHDFGQCTADTLAARLAAKGVQSIQLAPGKAICFAGDLATHAVSIGNALREHHIATAVVGCYINPIHPDMQMRNQSVETFFTHLECAHKLNGQLVGLETGTPTADYSPTPLAHTEEAFQDMLCTMERLVERAESLPALFIGIEAVHLHTVSNARKMNRLIRELGSARVRVIFDPVNLIDAATEIDQRSLFSEYIDLLHDRISVVHVKPQYTALNTQAAYGWIRQCSQPLDILLEGVSENDVERELATIKKQISEGS